MMKRRRKKKRKVTGKEIGDEYEEEEIRRGKDEAVS